MKLCGDRMNGDSDFNSQCKEAILSENVIDSFALVRGSIAEMMTFYGADCIQVVNPRYTIVHQPIADFSDIQKYNFYYSSFPKCYGLMDETNMEYIGVHNVRRQPFLNLLGRDVIVGFIDTGIDYQHEIFKNADNTSRVVRIWDQTIQTGTPPKGYYYGTEYTREQINEALKSDDPLSVVPSTDTNGHGTFIAGIAAGNIDIKNDFTGAAPLADIVMVKLKQAKKYLRDFYYIRDDVECFQETDLVMGTKYLLDLAIELKKPLVICIGVGTNSGGHDGSGIWDEYLENLSDNTGFCVVLPTGNEGNSGGHYRGIVPQTEDYVDAEINVGEGEKGFTLEFWVRAPSIYSIGFISPSGEYINRIPPRVNNNRVISFLFEPTVIYVDYRVIERRTGDESVIIRFESPTPGIWKIRVFREQSFNNEFDLWLPIKKFLTSNTYFIQPNPDITITDPGNTMRPITVAACNHVNNSIYINSGRGYTRRGNVKPDIAAPGVNIYGPAPGNTFSIKSGTSIAAAHTAGAAALLLEWAIVRENSFNFNTTNIKTLMIRGAKRIGTEYPNKQFGYGILDIYGAFESLRLTV
ncbi:MAG TPA: hypothetical protein DHW61_05715 [Lachnoclostridium phytofermentans]|uniref:Peptidase S8/S53 domain-containing protein n=2 Tax=Lachnoclostridium TaxID=1506553 RepID=A0A3D2X4S1_9FIRM|nr:hypothetical protein [Lachnoclostridium phytofermentans]